MITYDRRPRPEPARWAHAPAASAAPPVCDVNGAAAALVAAALEAALSPDGWWTPARERRLAAMRTLQAGIE